MKPSENTYSALIAIEGNQWHYHIPRYQREYVWGKYNWSKLIQDIYENDPGHYMGSVICVHTEEDLTPNTELIYGLVDGQQRLTTLSLLLAAIYKKISNLSSGNQEIRTSDEFVIKRNAIKKRLIKEVNVDSKFTPSWVQKSGAMTFCLRVQPSTQGWNLRDYLYILKEIDLIPDAPYPKYLYVRRIYKCYDYFLKTTPNTIQELYDLFDRISALSFIHISESSQSKAFMLFETLNYRGVPLSSIDIIKNKMLETLEKKFEIKIDEAYDLWQKLLRNLPEDRDQDRFLRQYYNAFKFDPKIKVSKISRATGSSLISIYENLITRDAKFILDDLLLKATVYNQFLEPEKMQESRIKNLLAELERIGAAPSYTFLLYLFSLPDSYFSEGGVKEHTVDLLCKYYFRRNVTDFPNTRELDSINIELIEKCQTEINSGNQLTYSFISQIILNGKGKPTSLDKFKEALGNGLFDNNENMARYALTVLDQRFHTKEYTPNLWLRNEKGLYIWTVEHIFPQGENIPQEWVEMIAGGDREEAERIRSEKVHSLGNLTLSGYNSNLSNQSFERKQSKSEATVLGEKISIGYKNGLALNNIPFMVSDQLTTLASTEKWTEQHIDSRNNVLVDMLIKQFSFEGEII